jgi:guanylate kinase
LASARNGNIRGAGSTGKLFVISAPSGAGKSTLCQKLLKNIPRMKMSVSYTTRKARAGEKNDVHYSFISEKRFKGMVERGEFAEWAMVHNNLYGTSLKRLKKLNKEGYDIILDIDTHGAAQIKKNYNNAEFIFILPPSMKELEKRLKKRRTDSKEVIQRRVENARAEIARYIEYDYVIVNDKIDKAYRELESLVITSRLNTEKVDHTWIKTLLQ